MPKHFPLSLILIAYLIVGALYAIRTPDWQAPDEPAHYNYAAQISANGCCPLIEPGDWDGAYLETLKAAHFAPDLLRDIDAIQYEDHQPPLYYLLAGMVYRLTDGSLIAVRLLSVIIGAGIAACAYSIALALLPDRRPVALAAASAAALIVAFIPQNLAILASVNNDALSNLLISTTLLTLIRRVQGKRVPVWGLGVLVGIGLLTKVNTIFLVGLVPLILLLHWWITPERRVDALLRRLIAFAVPTLILGGLWWLRNISVYGFPDIFGLGRHDEVVVGQLRTAELIAQVGFNEYLRRGIDTTFTSFWGQFGWMGLFMPTWAYWAVFGLLGAALLGGILGLILPRQSTSDPLRVGLSQISPLKGAASPDQPQPEALSLRRLAWSVLGLTLILAFLQYLYYNTEFVQFQGRYLYTGLIPFALLLALGLDGWRALLVRLFGDRAVFAWIPPLIAATLIPLSLFMIWRVIPQLAP